ncbi:MAG: WD40-repeat-containing domain protein, partial [Linnemannia gamsii]
SPNGCRIASVSLDRIMCLWNSESGEREQMLQGHSSRVNCVAFSPNGNQRVSGSADKTIVLWNIELGERVPVIRVLIDLVLSIAFSPHGQRIVYCCCDTSIRDTAGGAVFGTLITTAAYSPAGDLIATGGYDYNLRIWEAKS